MAETIEFITNIEKVPVEHLAILLGLAGIALAGFAIQAVLIVIKRKGDR